MNNKGQRFEEAALTHLKKQGLTLLERNYHSRFGEIDLIMKTQDTIVFIEVRFRAKASHGSALESVTRTKQRKIIKTAQCFMSHHELWGENMRFDVVAMSEPVSRWTRKPDIQWIPSAFHVPESTL